MKKVLFLFIAIAAVLSSCNDYETYGDLKEKERNAIAKFIADSSIVVITEDQFNQQGKTTNLKKNEFVKLDKSGVYMQIVRQGCGNTVQDGENTRLICRYSEFNILTDTITSLNNDNRYAAIPDIMEIARTGSSYTASFVSGVMYYYYGGSVPSGWLVPLNYVNVGRPASDDDEISKVRLIVPHSQGHSKASGSVIPYYYVITFERQA